MSNKQKLNDAFANINDALIESAARAPQSRHSRWERWGAVAVCVAIVLSFTFGVLLITKLTNSNSDPSERGWVVITSDNVSVEKRKNGLSGLQYTLCINYMPLQALHGDLLGIEPEQDECAEMLGQWLLSVVTFDYSQHFPLFADEILNDKIIPIFEKEGYDQPGAYEKMATVAADTVGFTHCRVEYAVKNVENSEQTLKTFLDQWGEYLTKLNVSVDDITQVCEYTIEEIKVYCNDLFWIGIDLPTIAFYQIDGVWYATPEMLDDDLSVDLLQSVPGEYHGYYKVRKARGVVERIENGYVVLEDTCYYLLRSETEEILPGDYVEIEYYSVGLEGYRKTDGVKCDLGVVASITRTEPNAQS